MHYSIQTTLEKGLLAGIELRIRATENRFATPEEATAEMNRIYGSPESRARYGACVVPLTETGPGGHYVELTVEGARGRERFGPFTYSSQAIEFIRSRCRTPEAVWKANPELILHSWFPEENG